MKMGNSLVIFNVQCFHVDAKISSNKINYLYKALEMFGLLHLCNCDRKCIFIFVKRELSKEFISTKSETLERQRIAN